MLNLTKFAFLCCLLVGVVSAQSSSVETVLSVNAGSFYSSLLGLGAFNNAKELSMRIKMDQNCAKYLFSPTDDKGSLCSTSWNKLFGTVRCGMFNSNHKDSDRFVWRRAQSCLKFSGQFVVGEVEDCAESELIELAAYTYDNGDIPYTQENQGRLLKEFRTKVRVDTWYTYKLSITPSSTVYQIIDESNVTLEAVTIYHRDCGSSYYIGLLQNLYFGGQCPAPQPVSVTYKPL